MRSIHSFTPGPLQTLLLLTTIAAATTDAPTQQFTFTSRNTQHTAYCGPTPGGASGQNDFTTAGPTHDVIAVSHPGGPPGFTPSQATSQIDAVLTTTSISVAIAGDAARSSFQGFGSAAVAAAHEDWIVTVTATAHFTLNVLMTAGSSEPATMPPISFFVVPWSAGASFTADPGTPPPSAYSFALSTPGSHSLAASGTMTPGQYYVQIQARAEGGSFAYPWNGSYAGSITLGIASTAAVTTRNAGTNPASFTCTLPVLGQTWQGTVDLATTGDPAAALFGALAPAQVLLPGGQTILLAGPLLVLGPVSFGPQAAFSLSLPLTNSLAGFVLPTQAIHFGGASDFALSNANDLTLGF